MDTYAMTFVFSDTFEGLNQACTAEKITKLVILHLKNRTLFLADFNRRDFYEPSTVKAYFEAPYNCKTIVEISIALDIATLRDREMIYSLCQAALLSHAAILKGWRQNSIPDIEQNFLQFAMAG